MGIAMWKLLAPSVGLAVLVACRPSCDANSHTACGDAESALEACGVPGSEGAFAGCDEGSVVACEAVCVIATPCTAWDAENRDEEAYDEWIACLDACEEGVDCAALDALRANVEHKECADRCFER